MTPDDIPSRLERLATAVSTSNLTFDTEHRTPVDRIIALGLASKQSVVTSNVLRLYLAKSPEAWYAAKASVLGVVRRLSDRRKWDLSPEDADKVATQSLLMHINPSCSHCKGHGFKVIPGTPTLSHKPRPPNKKLRVQIEATIATLEHIDSMTEMAVGRYLR